MRGRSAGEASAAMRRPVISQALSTEERNGRTGSPVPGHSVSTEPSCASYQLSQKPWWRSSFSTVRTVRSSLRCIVASPITPITPRPAAATVDQRPQPILVGEVWRDWTGPPEPLTSILSVARPRSVTSSSRPPAATTGSASSPTPVPRSVPTARVATTASRRRVCRDATAVVVGRDAVLGHDQRSTPDDETTQAVIAAHHAAVKEVKAINASRGWRYAAVTSSAPGRAW